MAHLAVVVMAFAMLLPILALPWLTPILLIPVLASVSIIRLRTVANRDTLTARSLWKSTTVGWDEVKGLKFTKSSWARATLVDGGELTLPAVSFSTLPLLAEASGGRVPNPYE